LPEPARVGAGSRRRRGQRMARRSVGAFAFHRIYRLVAASIGGAPEILRSTDRQRARGLELAEELLQASADRIGRLMCDGLDFEDQLPCGSKAADLLLRCRTRTLDSQETPRRGNNWHYRRLRYSKQTLKLRPVRRRSLSGSEAHEPEDPSRSRASAQVSGAACRGRAGSRRPAPGQGAGAAACRRTA
jgi:hypothetical protein